MTTPTRALRVRRNTDGTFSVRRPDGATRGLASLNDATALVAAIAPAPGEDRTPFYAVLMLLGAETDEDPEFNRLFDQAVPRREFPMPLWWEVSSAHGEGELALVGRLDEFHIEDVADGVRAVLGTGSFDNTVEETKAALDGMSNGANAVSVDYSYEEPTVDECTEWDPENPEWCVRARMRAPRIAIGGATMCGLGAFSQARVSLDGFPTVTATAAPPAVERPVPDCECEEVVIVASAQTVRALTAALALPTYPAAAFRRPDGVTGPTPLTLCADGSFYGAYPMEECHRGLPDRCQTAPVDPDFSEFLLTPVTLDDGSKVMAGPLTFQGSAHVANPSLSIAAVRASYDNTATVAGLVTLGHGDGYTWYAGMLRPGLSEDHLWEIAACAQVSPHWQPVGGVSRMAALHVVPTPGFAARPLVASGGTGLHPAIVPFLVRQYEALARQVADLAPLRELLPLAADTVVASLPPGPPKANVADSIRRDLAAFALNRRA